jgi:hypothetical protein
MAARPRGGPLRQELHPTVPEHPDTTVLLATFDPSVALAVVDVLRRRGVRAWAVADAASDPSSGALPGEAAVRVPEERREDALRVLADAMEEIAAGRWAQDADGFEAPVWTEDPHEDVPRPLVLERLRRFGGVGLLLVPLLILTLQLPPFDLRYGVLLLVGTMIVLVALRDRWRDH